MIKKKGFTIIELLIVVALILILFVISFNLVFGFVQHARNQASASTLSNINSMYRMSTAFLFIDEDKARASTKPIKLPTNSFSAVDEKAIEEKMLDSFADLANINYTLIDENGIATEGGVTITYYPYDDKPHEYYQWIDGVVYRTFNEATQTIK